MTEVEIAKGLSEAQRRAVLATKEDDLDGFWFIRGGQARDLTMRTLRQNGLVWQVCGGDVLTPLGLRVRTILQENSNGPA